MFELRHPVLGERLLAARPIPNAHDGRASQDWYAACMGRFWQTRLPRWPGLRMVAVLAWVVAGPLLALAGSRHAEWTAGLSSAASPRPAGYQETTMDCELHLQEGFAGETVDLEVDGVQVARIAARTRMQTGLAHIQKLALHPGQTVAVRLQGSNLFTQHRVAAGQPYIQVTLDNGALRIKATETSPGYL